MNAIGLNDEEIENYLEDPGRVATLIKTWVSGKISKQLDRRAF